MSPLTAAASRAVADAGHRDVAAIATWNAGRRRVSALAAKVRLRAEGVRVEAVGAPRLKRPANDCPAPTRTSAGKRPAAEIASRKTVVLNARKTVLDARKTVVLDARKTVVLDARKTV
jgi:hypothetical protein